MSNLVKRKTTGSPIVSPFLASGSSSLRVTCQQTWQWMWVAHHTLQGRRLVSGLCAISGALTLWDMTLLG